MAINYREQYASYNRYFVQIKDIYNKRPEVRESVELLLSLLMISILVVFALRPTVTTIAELFASVNSQNEIKQKLEDKVVALNRAREEWNKNQNALVVLDQAIPAKAAPDIFLRQVEGLSAKHNLSLNSYSVDEVLLFGKSSQPKARSINSKKSIELPLTKPQNVSFIVEGTYQNISGFLKDIENLQQIILIDSFSLSISSSSEEEGGLSLKVSGNVPYFDSELLTK